MKLPKIIGIAGTNGSGKDTLGELRRDRSGALFMSLSDALRALLDEEGLEHTRSNLSSLSQSLRATEGDGAVAVRAIGLFNKQNDTDQVSLVSVRTPGEAQAIKDAGGQIVWVDADSKRRYDRVTTGARGRIDDYVSYEEFLEHEYNEMHPSEAGGGLNSAGVKALADIMIENNFDSVDEYITYLIETFEL